MSLKKAIKYGKEHRTEYGTKGQPYAKAVDPMCRNHKGCDWCKGNRTYQSEKEKQKTYDTLRDIPFEVRLDYALELIKEYRGEDNE